MFNLTSKFQTYIIYGLISLLLASSSSALWLKVKLSYKDSKIESQELIIKGLRSDVKTAVAAEKSCSKSIKKLAKATKKKQTALNNYRNKLKKGVTDENITNTDEFIDYANRLYK